MDVTETLSDGLRRGLKITIPAADLEAKMVAKLAEVKDRVQIRGFRPGKVPLSHLRKTHGRTVMAEIIETTINESSLQALKDRKERPALQPAISMSDDESQTQAVLDGKSDLTVDMTYELIPNFEVGDLSGLVIEKPVVEVSEEDISERMGKIAEANRPYEEKDSVANEGDKVSLAYFGKVDDEPFAGGEDPDANIVIGAGQFIPGFEEQLIGKKAGDEAVITITFPQDYGAEALAGKEAQFDVSIKSVASPGEIKIDDDFAKSLGLEDLSKLKDTIKTQIKTDYAGASRQKVKRQLLDQLDERYDFDLPPTMLEQEFEGIWTQVLSEMERSNTSFEDNETTEEKSREEYHKIAERRVRLGLVLAEIGDEKKISVDENEMRKAVMQQAMKYPGKEREIIEFLSKNPAQLAGIRAPIFEEKVVDYILELATVIEKTVTKEELLADEDDENV